MATISLARSGSSRRRSRTSAISESARATSGLIVGPGSIVDIGGQRWEVTAVEKPEPRRHGWVALRHHDET
jgi:hypothetical protein